MSLVICIAGESGSGKTTSLCNLDPTTTFIIDSDRKGLSWRGWKKQYNKEQCNYIQTSDIEKISKMIRRIEMEEKFKHVKTLVIDTLNTIMVDDEMKRSKEKGYDKWVDLAACIWDLIASVNLLREDLTVVCLAHTQTERDESGYMFTRIKTNGKKLDKLCLESKFTTVLLAKCVNGKYVFETNSKNSTAKSPMGAFENFEIENDIAKVIETLRTYEEGE